MTEKDNTAKDNRDRQDRGAHPSVLVALRWPLAIVLVAVIFSLLGFLIYRETLRGAERVAGSTSRTMGEAVKNLVSGNITETFLASIPEFDPDGTGNLEVATLTAVETFKRSDERRILWDMLSLGVAESEIRVPVTYRYHLRLNDAWHLEIQDGTCYVLAPTLRPSLPPAIHTDRMEKRSDADWLRFDAEDQLLALERSVTPTLGRFAKDARHLGLVRENARRAVETFVKSWLLREDLWGAERVRHVEIVFPDEEIDDPTFPDIRRPTD